MSLLNATTPSPEMKVEQRQYSQHPTPPPTSAVSTKKTSLDFLLNHDSAPSTQIVCPPSPPSATVASNHASSTEEEAAAVLGSLRFMRSVPSASASPPPFIQHPQSPDTPPTSPLHTTFQQQQPYYQQQQQPIPSSPTPSHHSVSPSPPPSTPTTASASEPRTRTNKIYECTYPSCTKTFRTSHSLRSHLRCHGEPQFPCTICGAPFRRKHDLHRHGRSLHNTGNPHACQFCHKTFPRADALRRHINSRSPTHGCHVARVAAAREAVSRDEMEENMMDE
ncbi:hypothetical protein HDU97_006525 [Phlyctochytrium planicorne]|nr:hypothetical protein HDU97_006525 [Phlyctochytrium planicorne]